MFVASGVSDGSGVFVDSLRGGCVGTHVAGIGGLNSSQGSIVGSGVAVGDIPPASVVAGESTTSDAPTNARPVTAARSPVTMNFTLPPSATAAFPR